MSFTSTRSRFCLVVVCLATSAAGCDGRKYYLRDEGVSHYRQVATEIAYPQVDAVPSEAATQSQPPRTIAHLENSPAWELTLEEAIRTALRNSTVIRDVGGRVVDLPQGAPSVYDPAIGETDPRFGVEAALSAFDADLAAGITWSRPDNAVNNSIIVGGIPTGQPFLLQQDLATFGVELRKIGAAGTQMALRNRVDYNLNNVGVPPNVFGSSYNTTLEFAVRQPLLQGAGTTFNRIAGPQATPGFFFSNGVLLARIDTDISLADFEAAVRGLVSDVEDTYWELYFAYRDLDTQVKARDSLLEQLRVVRTKLELGAASRVEESQVREQYFRFQAAAEAALGGSGSAGDPSGGLYGIEATLRRLMGLPVNDGRIIRPIDDPVTAPITFDWETVVAEALGRRVELRQQRWRIKRRELELVAAKNFLLPRLDLAAAYRLNGFGDKLIASDSDNPRFQNAFETLTSGDFAEWQLGLQLDVPIGFRQAWAAVRNAELRLARERAVLEEQELGISHRLGAAIRNLDGAHRQTQTNFNRLLAAQEHEARAKDRFDQGAANSIDLFLEAQELRAAAERAYYRSLLDYNKALKQLELERGTLLASNQIYLSEGPWPAEAYDHAFQRGRHRANARPVDIGTTEPPPFVGATMPAPIIEVVEESPPTVVTEP